MVKPQCYSEQSIFVPNQSLVLEGLLTIPKQTQKLVVLAHGSGSTRHSRHNGSIAARLHQRGFATLVMELLTPEENDIDMRTRHFRFDLGLLASRLTTLTDWLSQQPETRHLTRGYLGADASSAAAVLAAVNCPGSIQAIASRSGRFDLVGPALSQLPIPILMMVGGHDIPTLGINQDAFNQIQTEKRLEIVPRATHLFEEAGALERMTDLTSQWFAYHLSPLVNAGT